VNSNANQPVLGMFLNGRYKIVQDLGIGILGQTYVAEDSWRNGTPQCIVKCFIPQNHYSSQQWDICQHWFTSNADALRQLGTHDQIPKFLDSFEDEHGFYLVRELIVGEPLSAALPMSPGDNKRWSEQECVALLDEVLSILELIHRQGIIHGDIKPSNLIRRTSDSKLVLMDFGVAHPIHRTLVTPQFVRIHPTLDSVATAPVGYSPANELSSQLCFGSDLYALGAIAIQALTGLDFLQLSLNPTTHQIDWRQQAAVSETLAGLLNSMIQTDFESRYQLAADVRTALRSLGMIEEEQELRTEELSEPSNSNSSLDVSDGKDLALCFHHVTQLPLNPVSQSSEVRENQGIQAAATQSQESSTNEKWEYARELAIACLPKLPPVMAGIGAGLATSNALAISFGLYSLLNTAASNPGLDLLAKATEQYQAGNLDEAIALTKSIPTNSSVYQESVATVDEWRSEWDKAVA
jgi:serine/threonine protein kinase